jgi:carbamoyltransferase
VKFGNDGPPRSTDDDTGDPFRCFMGNELDLLVVGNCLLHKEAQDPALKVDYSPAFEAD